MALNDGVMIKDNHIRLGGGIARALAQLRASGATSLIEIEVEKLEEVDPALEEGADMLLLDNMPLDDIREAVRRSRGRAKTEISGGVTLGSNFGARRRPAPISFRAARSRIRRPPQISALKSNPPDWAARLSRACRWTIWRVATRRVSAARAWRMGWGHWLDTTAINQRPSPTAGRAWRRRGHHGRRRAPDRGSRPTWPTWFSPPGSGLYLR